MGQKNYYAGAFDADRVDWYVAVRLELRLLLDYGVSQGFSPSFVPKSRAKSTVYPIFYAEIVPCFPGVREMNISLVRIHSAPPPHNALILNDFAPNVLCRVFRDLCGALAARDLKLQKKIAAQNGSSLCLAFGAIRFSGGAAGAGLDFGPFRT